MHASLYFHHPRSTTLIYSTTFFGLLLAPSTGLSLSMTSEIASALLRFAFLGAGTVGNSASPPAKYRTLSNELHIVIMRQSAHLSASKTILPTMLRYMIEVHFAGESLKDDGRDLNATKALDVSSCSANWKVRLYHRAYPVSDIDRERGFDVHHK